MEAAGVARALWPASQTLAAGVLVLARQGLAVLTLLVSVALPAQESHAERSATTVRIGVPYFGSDAGSPRLEAAFSQGLRDLGYVEGRNLVIERRCCANGNGEQFGAFMTDLIQRKVDVLLAVGPQAAAAAKQATATIPIVFVAVSDPVRLGLVANLAHPGGNVTGFSHLALGKDGEALGKQMQLIKDMVPPVSRLAVLINPSNPVYQQVDFPAILANLARTVGVTPVVVEARAPTDLTPAFEKAAAGRAQAMVVTADTVTFAERTQIAALAARYRLPATYWFREHVEAGGLMSYGVDLADLWRRAAGYVDKIVKGTKPGDLPVERPTRFELIINRNAAKALGLAIPPALSGRADEILE